MVSFRAHRSLDARVGQGGEGDFWQKAHIHRFALAAKKKSSRFLRLCSSALSNAKPPAYNSTLFCGPLLLSSLSFGHHCD